MPDLNVPDLTAMDLTAPNWPAPATVKAAVSLRMGGVSEKPYDSLNLAGHVGDDPASVAANRKLLAEQIGIANIFWMEQVHGTDITYADITALSEPTPSSDACWTQETGIACAVMTADCLPLLVCNKQGTKVAALHAGWRGLADGVIRQSLRKTDIEPADTLVWLGPAIGPGAYQVGEDVFEAFAKSDAFGQIDFDTAFVPDKPGHYLCDLYQLARLELSTLGISAIYGGDQCTYTQSESYFSYRRDGQTGRMVSLVWLG